MAPRKEIEHRACLVPWPSRDDEPAPRIALSSLMLQEEAEKFGLEVIDVWWIRHVLLAVAAHFEAIEKDLPGETCPDCGMVFQHSRFCQPTRLKFMKDLVTNG